ncbi:MAG: BatA domain-containing protein [Deltaproteobacteria bacterium]|nr:BatA domain-containing protein [Deltaproteobacteria bacterium]
MGFESPWMLLGVFAALVPLAVHMHLRRHAPVVVMDAVMRLVLTGGRTRVRLRLVHAALLATRVGIVALVAVLFAEPFWRRPAGAAVEARHPVALAVVIDDSLSMRLSSGGRTAWAQARSRVSEALAGLPAESEVWVVLAGRPFQAHPSGPTLAGRTSAGWDADTPARFVSERNPSRTATDLAGAVRAAASLVRSSALRDRRILVASDFLDHGLDGFPAAADLAGIEARAMDVGPASSPRNRSISRVVAEPAPDVSPRHVRVRVEVENGGDQVLDEVVTVRLGRSGAARKVSCPPGGRCSHEVLMALEDGALAGEARLPPDDLPDDDARFFPVAPRDRDAVLVVNGEPRRLLELDEPFFLLRALGLRLEDQAGLPVTTVRPEELSPLHLSAVGAAVLANVPSLLPEQVRAVADFVASGGGVLVTVGDQVRPETWGEIWGALLPAPIRDVVGAGGPPDPGETVGWVSPDHPVTARLGAGAGSLSTVEVRRWAVLEGSWAQGSQVVARLRNGAPLIVERRIGRGAALALLTSIDADWTDFPLRPAYAPLVRQAASYLATAGGPRPRASIEVGEPRRIELPEGADHAVVTPPSGSPVRVTVTDDYTGTAVPGVYRVEAFQAGRTDAVRAEAFVVNTAPGESVLTREQGVPAALASADGPAAGTARPGSGSPPFRKLALVPHVLVLVLLLLLAEAVLRGKA